MLRIDGPFQVIMKTNDNYYQIDIHGKYDISSNFNVYDILPYVRNDFILR